MTADSPMPTASPQPTVADRRLAELAVAGLETLGFEVAPHTDGGWRVQPVRPGVPSRLVGSPPRFNGQTSFAFISGSEPPAGVEPLSTTSPLWQWMLEQLAERRLPLSAAPVGDPQAVHEFSGPLLSQYQVDGGSVHLAGCRIEAFPFVRLLRFDESGNATEALVPAAGAVSEQSEFTAALITQLDLNHWEPAEPPRGVALAQMNAIHREASEARQGLTPDGEPISLEPTDGDDDPPLLVAEWCHRARGKFEFEIGDARLTVGFDDWARHLKPPPITCPVTGEPTYHLAITGDGRLIAAEQLAPCAVCRQRLPRTELSASSVSGQLICKNHLLHCPISGEPLLEAECVECPSTRLPVSPAAVRKGQSTLLEELEPVDAGETALARLRLDHALLEQYRHWRLARGADVDLYVGGKLTGQVLITVRRDTGELLAAAQKSKWSWSWKPVELG